MEQHNIFKFLNTMGDGVGSVLAAAKDIESKGVVVEEADEFWKDVEARYQELISTSKEIEDRPCAFFVLVALDKYLRLAFDFRKLIRLFKHGTLSSTVMSIFDRAGVSRQTFLMFHDPRAREIDLVPLRKDIMMPYIYKTIRERKNAAYVKVRVDMEDGRSDYHAIGVLPSTQMGPDGIPYQYIFDCNGDFAEELKQPNVHILMVIEITSPPLPPKPKELKGGRKKTKKNRARRKKTNGRRV